jgi:dienelactone hydrolase
MAYEGMIAETISINGDKGEPISAYVARPLGAGPFPGMVLLHHAPGWDEWYREATRKFAHHGYATISHNLYHRAGEGKADDVAAKVRAEGGVRSPGSTARSGCSAPAPADARLSSMPVIPTASTRRAISGAAAW